MKTVVLEYKSEVTYRLVVNEEDVETALANFANDKYDLNEAIEADSETDFDNVNVVTVY